MGDKPARAPDGRWLSGESGNRAGINQFTNPRSAIKHRIDLAVVRELEGRPECATTFAEKLADALADPEEHLDFLRLALDRVWPSVGKLEVSGPDGGAIETRSADEERQLTEEFGEAVSDNPEVAAEVALALVTAGTGE